MMQTMKKQFSGHDKIITNEKKAPKCRLKREILARVMSILKKISGD